jgi:hypothetical protein
MVVMVVVVVVVVVAPCICGRSARRKQRSNH